MAVTAERERTSTSAVRWEPWVAGVSFLLIAAWFNRAAITSEVTEDGDMAADALRALAPWAQADGIFSRWGFHHPGPVLFWLKWFGMQVGELPGISLLGGQILVCLAVPAVAVGVLGWLCWQATGNRWAYVFAVVVTLLTSSRQLAPWAPSVSTWMAVLAVVAVAAMTLEQRWAAPLAAFAGMSMIHLHVVYVPAGVATLAVVAVVVWRRGLAWRPTAIVVGLMSLPLLVDLISGESEWRTYAAGPPDDRSFEWRPLTRGLGWSVSPFDTFSNLAYTLGILTILSTVLVALIVLRTRPADPLTFCVAGGLLLLAFVVVVAPFGTKSSSVGGGPVPLVFVPALSLWRPTTQAARLVVVAVASLTGWWAFAHHEASTSPGSGLAEAALADIGPAHVLVIDHAGETTGGYIPAAALRLLAERSGIESCVLADRWPHWTDETCTDRQIALGTVVAFTSADSYTIN